MNIYDIAKLSGVSIATVSRVLNDKPGVSEHAKYKVLSVIEETNFIPNQLAKSLANKKSYVIGIVIPGINHYYSRRVDAINKICKEAGYSLMITADYKGSSSVDDSLNNFNLLIEKRVDGIIYFPTHVSEQHIELISRLNETLPIVITDSEIHKLDLPCVLQDSVSPTKDIMEYLLQGGHKHIGLINGHSADAINNQRFLAYQSSLERYNIILNEKYIEVGVYSLKSGYKAMKKLLAKTMSGSHCDMTAIYAANDKMAMGAIKAIREAGLNVPEDISVIGYDGIEFGQYYSPSLTTVRVDQYKMGQIAAEMMLDLIEKHEVLNTKVIMDYDIIFGGSSRTIS